VKPVEREKEGRLQGRMKVKKHAESETAGAKWRELFEK